MKKVKNYNDLLIWSAAVVTVIRYAAAFVASDMGEITGFLSGLVTFLLGISGLGMGILDVIGGAALFQGWRKAMPRDGHAWPMRFKVLTFFVFGLILNGIVIIVPFTVSRVMQETMKVALGGGFFVWLWAGAVNVAPYLLIGGVAMSSNIVQAEAENTGNFPTSQGGNFRENSENSGKFKTAKVRWDKVERSEYEWLSTAKTGEIQGKYGLDERTARNWRSRAQSEMVKNG